MPVLKGGSKGSSQQSNYAKRVVDRIRKRRPCIHDAQAGPNFAVQHAASTLVSLCNDGVAHHVNDVQSSGCAISAAETDSSAQHVVSTLGNHGIVLHSDHAQFSDRVFGAAVISHSATEVSNRRTRQRLRDDQQHDRCGERSDAAVEAMNAASKRMRMTPSAPQHGEVDCSPQRT